MPQCTRSRTLDGMGIVLRNPFSTDCFVSSADNFLVVNTRRNIVSELLGRHKIVLF